MPRRNVLVVRIPGLQQIARHLKNSRGQNLKAPQSLRGAPTASMPADFAPHPASWCALARRARSSSRSRVSPAHWIGLRAPARPIHAIASIKLPRAVAAEFAPCPGAASCCSQRAALRTCTAAPGAQTPVTPCGHARTQARGGGWHRGYAPGKLPQR
jgi:hypothetical protein